ncbi:hypothetical protein BT67DRAFT_435868 [Trichocladium antarcticum]|uniref:Uncharacterized protein n=1 Tax=Trichocladium antarcticum TaxID=1450529 RepID=A0AAN6UFG4_9PEZI|nr:hypothetical protein BT67DRAFT_435868 [Trichocladium antarcticum]
MSLSEGNPVWHPSTMPYSHGDEKPVWLLRVEKFAKRISDRSHPTSHPEEETGILMLVGEMLASLENDKEAAARCADAIREYYTAFMLRSGNIDHSRLQLLDGHVLSFRQLEDHAVGWTICAVAGMAFRIGKRIRPADPNHKRLADVLIEIKKKRHTGPWDDTLGWETWNLDWFGTSLTRESDLEHLAPMERCSGLINQHALVARLVAADMFSAVVNGPAGAHKLVQEGLVPASRGWDRDRVVAARAVIASHYILLAGEQVRAASQYDEWLRWAQALAGQMAAEGDLAGAPEWDLGGVAGVAGRARKVVRRWIREQAPIERAATRAREEAERNEWIALQAARQGAEERFVAWATRNRWID